MDTLLSLRLNIFCLSPVLALSLACSSSVRSDSTSSASGTGSGGTSSGGGSGGDSSGGSSTGSPTDVVDGGVPDGRAAWAAGFAHYLCGALFACQDTVISADTIFQDEATCLRVEAANWLETSIEPQPGEVSSADARLQQSQQCLGDLVALVADAGPCAAVLPFLIDYNQPRPASCQQGALAVPGTLSPGAPCVSQFQCSSGRCEQSSGCGVCGPPFLNLGSGAACVDYDDCVPGLICSAGRCRAFVANGQSCTPSDLCAPLTSCIDGICQPAFLPGHSCVTGETSECQSEVCENSTCTAFPIVSIGSMCGYSADLRGYVLCDPETSACDIVDTQTEAGYCIAKKGIGERCFVSKDFDGEDCVGGANCLDGRCEPTLAACLDDGGIPETVADAGPVVLPDASGDFAALIAAFAQSYTYACEGVVDCPALSAVRALLGGSAASCEAAVLPSELAQANIPGLDPTSALKVEMTCNAELAQLDPCLAASFLITGYDSPACAGVEGTLPAGAACATSVQCASGNCSTSWAGSGCGVCGNVVSTGASCNAQSDCAGEAACAEGFCGPWGQFDAGCGPSDPCAPQFVCSSEQCSSGLAVGSSCTPAQSLCNPDLICNATTNQCEAELVANADAGMNDAGEFDCGYLTSGSVALCPAGSACQMPDATSIMGSCVAAGAPGSPCTSAGSWEIGSGNCNFPASCINGVCGLPPTAVCE